MDVARCLLIGNEPLGAHDAIAFAQFIRPAANHWRVAAVSVADFVVIDLAVGRHHDRVRQDAARRTHRAGEVLVYHPEVAQIIVYYRPIALVR